MPDSTYILVAVPAVAAVDTTIDPARGIREMTAQVVESAVKVPSEMLLANFEVFFRSISGLLESVPETRATFRIDEVEFAAEITGEGELRLIGAVKAGLKGGITIKLKRQATEPAPHA